MNRREKLVKDVRRIASRGRMDDADVQVIFDLADECDRLWEVICTYDRALQMYVSGTGTE